MLGSVAKVLDEYEKTVVEVAGHTDSTGTHAYNMQLSKERAGSVTNYLASRGVPANRMVPVGAGPDYPIASNQTEEGRAQNRRVEITLRGWKTPGAMQGSAPGADACCLPGWCRPSRKTEPHGTWRLTG